MTQTIRAGTCIDCGASIFTDAKAGYVARRCQDCKKEHRPVYSREYRRELKRHKLLLQAYREADPRCKNCGANVPFELYRAGDIYCRIATCEKTRVVVEQIRAERAAWEAEQVDVAPGMERPGGNYRISQLDMTRQG